MDDLLALSGGQLSTWALAFARERGLPDGALRLTPPLHEDEANGLALARGAGLVEVQPDGVFRLAGAAQGKGPYNLFSRGPAPSLNREYLVQIAAFSELVLQHGWPARRVAFEYDALDLAALDDSGRAVVVAEAKRDAASLDRMLAEMGAVTSDQIAAPTNTTQRKVAAMARLAPVVFWAVAPGIRRVFDVEVDHDGVPRLRHRDGLLKGPRTELDCPICGSEEDVLGSPLPDGRISLVCTPCDHRWSRTPRTVCRRCGSADVEAGAYRGWAYDDVDAAADDTMAPWHYVDWDVYRCQGCRHVWQVGRRAG
ncbi:hypothetical protein N5079_30435 [Planotetraspora sp. A-T 1434]|uniref:hypothetical protein n=1 Tax=Planotetraspora sp. A-T 1434 TaxID=2979219 RepID=UPI0021C04A69|nr:hypothetical protein [Planotetraspora sp. A-T 1434]MCT9934532.1 hypothetical protein [Planotetraspora sp. A-T 1434]